MLCSETWSVFAGADVISRPIYFAPAKRQYEAACIAAGLGAASGLPALLHRQLRLQAGDVTIDRGDRQHAALALVAQQAVPLHDVAVDIDLVPGLGVADIIDRHVVMLAPEERHRVERLARAQHVARRGLALAFRHHPMLDP